MEWDRDHRCRQSLLLGRNGRGPRVPGRLPRTRFAKVPQGSIQGYAVTLVNRESVAPLRTPTVPAEVASSASAAASPPFRFYDNRQKYLAFVNTCNEKSAVAHRAARELANITPTPPGVRVFDAGMGDGTVITRLMRSMHREFPTVPLLVIAKEISLEDVRLGLEKLPDRFHEHPATVFVVTNLNYAEAPTLMPRDIQQAAAFNWQELRLTGKSTDEYADQIEKLGTSLAFGWQTRPSPKTGNPVYVRPSVLVIYREDHKFMLENVIPRPGRMIEGFDVILASQPWRARTPAQLKARKILAPLARNLAPGGRLITIQSCGKDPGLEIIQQVWPGEQPFKVDRHQLLAALKEELGRESREYTFSNLADDKAVFRYDMHTLPSEIADRIGTSTLMAAWNAAIYVAQIEDERLAVVPDHVYREATQQVLRRHGGLWFNDETFVVARRRG